MITLKCTQQIQKGANLMQKELQVDARLGTFDLRGTAAEQPAEAGGAPRAGGR